MSKVFARPDRRTTPRLRDAGRSAGRAADSLNHRPSPSLSLQAAAAAGASADPLRQLQWSADRFADGRGATGPGRGASLQRAPVVQRVGMTDSEIANDVVTKVMRETGGSPNGLGVVPLGTKRALAASILRRDHKIEIDPKSIDITRRGEADDAATLRVGLSAALKTARNPAPAPAKPIDPAEFKALSSAVEARNKAVEGLLEEVFGDPLDAVSMMRERPMSLEDLIGDKADGLKVRNALIEQGFLLDSTAPPKKKTPEELNLERHLYRAGRLGGVDMGSEQPKLASGALFDELAKLIVDYSEGPDAKSYPFSVKFNPKKRMLEVVARKRSELNSALDVGLGTAKMGGSLVARIQNALLKMTAIIQTEFERDSPNAQALHVMQNAISRIRHDLCNQDNAKDLAKALNSIKNR